MLNQEVGWFDVQNQAELSSTFDSEIMIFKGGIGEKIPSLFQTFAIVVSGLIVSFLQGWLMSLVILVSLPAYALGSGFFIYTIAIKEKRDKESYAKANGRV